MGKGSRNTTGLRVDKEGGAPRLENGNQTEGVKKEVTAEGSNSASSQVSYVVDRDSRPLE